MSGVNEIFQNLWSKITEPFDQGGEYQDGDEIFDGMNEEAGIYPTDENAALNPIYPETRGRKHDNVVPMATTRGYEVIVHEPRSFEETMAIVKNLKEKRTVILNLHLLDKETSRRTVDFVCGATHALNGNQQRIGDTVFIFTPNNINLTTEVQKVNKLYNDVYWNKQQ